jgi:hypothetical protein
MFAAATNGTYFGTISKSFVKVKRTTATFGIAGCALG